MAETKSSSYASSPSQSPLHNGNGNGHINGYVNGNGNPLYAARSAPSTPRHSQPTKILGSIDENGGMAPDIPLRNHRRRSPDGPTTYGPHNFLRSLMFPTSTAPPKDDLETITGPHGEKFTDVRQNRRSYPGELQGKKKILRRGGWRTYLCLGLVLVIIAAVVAIGVVIGLKRMNSGHRYDHSRLSVQQVFAALLDCTISPILAEAQSHEH